MASYSVLFCKLLVIAYVHRPVLVQCNTKVFRVTKGLDSIDCCNLHLRL